MKRYIGFLALTVTIILAVNLYASMSDDVALKSARAMCAQAGKKAVIERIRVDGDYTWTHRVGCTSSGTIPGFVPLGQSVGGWDAAFENLPPVEAWSNTDEVRVADFIGVKVPISNKSEFLGAFGFSIAGPAPAAESRRLEALTRLKTFLLDLRLADPSVFDSKARAALVHFNWEWN